MSLWFYKQILAFFQLRAMLLYSCICCTLHPPSSQSFGARARRVAMGYLGGGASVLLQLSMVCVWEAERVRVRARCSHSHATRSKIITYLGSFSFAAHQSRLKGEPERCMSIVYFPSRRCSLPLKITADGSIPVLRQEQARKQTNMDAVRYSFAAADACTEIMLLGSYSQSLILPVDNWHRDAIRIKEKFDTYSSEQTVFCLKKKWNKPHRASNRPFMMMTPIWQQLYFQEWLYLFYVQHQFANSFFLLQHGRLYECQLLIYLQQQWSCQDVTFTILSCRNVTGQLT